MAASPQKKKEPGKLIHFPKAASTTEVTTPGLIPPTVDKATTFLNTADITTFWSGEVKGKAFWSGEVKGNTIWAAEVKGNTFWNAADYDPYVVDLGTPDLKGASLLWATKDLGQVKLDEVSRLNAEVGELRTQVKQLEQLIRAIPQVQAQESGYELRTLSYEEAKKEIIDLFLTGRVLDYGAIATKLKLDLPLVVDICNQLEEEGKIG
jgi:hypothetical protein